MEKRVLEGKYLFGTKVPAMYLCNIHSPVGYGSTPDPLSIYQPASKTESKAVLMSILLGHLLVPFNKVQFLR